ncbi:single-stranded DNA-binding protein [Lactococcus lactis]
MINNVTLVGRITKEPELRYTPQNKAVASFTLAVNRAFKNANGEREADFINCVIWGKSAENLANWTHKGQLIGVTGSIQTRNYENQQGQRIYITEVVASNFQVLEKVIKQMVNELVIQLQSHKITILLEVIQWKFQMMTYHSNKCWRVAERAVKSMSI